MQAILLFVVATLLGVGGILAGVSRAPAEPESVPVAAAPSFEAEEPAAQLPEVDPATVQVALQIGRTERFAAYSSRLASWMPDAGVRDELLRTVLAEAARVHLDPHLVLAVIQIESSFRQFAVSSAGARGFMQVMPFWTRALGDDNADLFQMQVNVRFGCEILRHYIALENGDLFQALSRYKGTPGRLDYSKLVIDTWRTWRRGGMSI